ncbi:MAG: hypothetical protein V1778_02425 [bacterium]
MAKILFIDDRMDEVLRQWHLSGCEAEHVMLPVRPFESLKLAAEAVSMFQPDVIVIGFGLGVAGVDGAMVIRFLRDRGYTGSVVANSGGGVQQFLDAGVEVDASADRNPAGLTEALQSVVGGKR